MAAATSADTEGRAVSKSPLPEDGRGRQATSPAGIPRRGWKDVALRVWGEANEDNLTVIAAGCAFYALLGLFPAITALVAIAGIVADPAEVERQLGSLQAALPPDAFSIVRDQVRQVAAADGGGALSWGAALGLILALYSASAVVKTLFTALNVAYEEKEERSFLRFTAAALLFTLLAVVGVVVGLTAIVGVPAALAFLEVGPLGWWLVRIASWAVTLLLISVGIGLLYRFGPSRAPAGWRWLTPGAVFASVGWLLVSLLFSFYAANFAGYNETYGALGGVIALLMWLWLTSLVVLVGAKLNAELELQTSRDTTTGRERPMGERRAYAADHVAQTRDRGERETQ